MTPVTCLTKDATLDDLSTQDYADIWRELKDAHSLRDAIAVMQSALSPATWSQYDKGEKTLTRQMRNDLRRGVGMAQLLATVAEATAQASPDAAVWQIGIVGETGPDTIIMVSDSEPLWIHVNGDGVTVQDTPVTPVTAPPRARTYIPRPYASKNQYERLQALGLTWGEVIEVGLKEFEA